MAHTSSSAAPLDLVLLLVPADALLQGCGRLLRARCTLYPEHGTEKENYNSTILTYALFPLLGKKKAIYAEK